MKHRNREFGSCSAQVVKQCCQFPVESISGYVRRTHMRQSWRNTEECIGCHVRSGTHGWRPLCPNPRLARLAVEAPRISVPDPDATPMQLEESEETRRPKHRALPTNVSKEDFGAHQLTHLPFRSWCDHCVRGKAVDDALTRTEVKPRRVWTTSSWRGRRILNTRRQY